MLPVIIEDLIKKVTDTTKHPEQRQHYVATLTNIIKAAQAALDQFEKTDIFITESVNETLRV